MKTHQIVYIIENNYVVRSVEIIKLVGNFAIVKFNNGGGIHKYQLRDYMRLRKRHKKPFLIKQKKIELYITQIV